MNLKDKVALITGSGRGIGRSIAEKYAELGAKIVISDVSEETMTITAKEISDKYGVETHACKCDVSKSADCDALVKSAVDRFGKLDILVNNAGITRDGLMMRMKDEDWDLVLNINLKGAFFMTRSATSAMMKTRYGRIINIASIVGQIGNAGQANYSASKGGLIALTKTTAREWAKRGINANAIAPGFIATEMTEKLSVEQKSALTTQIPMERLGSPLDIANASAFLASDMADYITGQVIAVNGGMAM